MQRLLETITHRGKFDPSAKEIFSLFFFVFNCVSYHWQIWQIH